MTSEQLKWTSSLQTFWFESTSTRDLYRSPRLRISLPHVQVLKKDNPYLAGSLQHSANVLNTCRVSAGLSEINGRSLVLEETPPEKNWKVLISKRSLERCLVGEKVLSKKVQHHAGTSRTLTSAVTFIALTTHDKSFANGSHVLITPDISPNFLCSGLYLEDRYGLPSCWALHTAAHVLVPMVLAAFTQSLLPVYRWFEQCPHLFYI